MLPDVAAKAVLNNELRRALLDIADKSGDKFVSRVAKRLSEFTTTLESGGTGKPVR